MVRRPLIFPLILIRFELGLKQITSKILKHAHLIWFLAKIVSMIRKYHNHELQTNPWHREEEPHNDHETPGRQTKQSNQLSPPQYGDCKTRIDTK